MQGEKIQALLDAAGVTVEPFWPGMFAKALEGRNIGDLLCSVGSPGGGGGASVGGAAAGGGDAQAEEKTEEKKEEKKEESEESDDDMGFGTFTPFPQEHAPLGKVTKTALISLPNKK
jgi:large subunit ribosomal protein LP1